MTAATSAAARRAAKARVTVQVAADGRMHAYAGCAGPGRRTLVLTVDALVTTDPALIAGCLRHRYDSYTADLAA